MSASSVTDVIVEHVLDAPAQVGAAHLDAVERVLVDTVGCAIAGLATPTLDALRRWALTERAPGRAAVWGGGETRSPSQAAMINGTAGHALDWDDAAPAMPMHPGTVVWPALLAVIDDDTTTVLERLAAAYSVGNTVLRAVSELLPIDAHYGRGWHNTSTSGRIGAVAALGHLLELTRHELATALGLVASTAAGSRANFGTMTKPLHAGLAARDAVMAVQLARTGFTAHPRQLEHPHGFLAQYGEPSIDGAPLLPALLEHWSQAWITDYALKRYPSCYATQAAIEAGIDLRRRLVAGQTVMSAQVWVKRGGLAALRTQLPRTGLEGKFSIEYVVALALRNGTVRQIDFPAGDLPSSAALDLISHICVTETAAPPDGRPFDPAGQGAVVRIQTSEGRALTNRVDITYGDARRPLPDVELAAKFAECTDLPSDTTDRWIEWFRGLVRGEHSGPVQLKLAQVG